MNVLFHWSTRQQCWLALLFAANSKREAEVTDYTSRIYIVLCQKYGCRNGSKFNILKFYSYSHMFIFNIYSFIFTICLFTFNICLFIFSICLFTFSICLFIFNICLFAFSICLFTFNICLFIFSIYLFIFNICLFTLTFVCIQYQYLLKFNVYAH